MRKSKQTRWWLLVIPVIFCAGFYYRADLSDVASRISSYIAYPLIRIQNAIVYPVKRWFEKKSAIAELESLIQKYQAQNHDLLAELVACKSETSFYQDTANLVAFHAQYTGERARIAQVLVRQFSDESHFFLIDQGEQDGVTVDMVVVYKNCLVGRIVAVYPWYSKVILISDRQCKVPALSVINKARGIYSGINKTEQSSFDYVSHLTKLNHNELVISSGEGLVFPKGFGVGTIKSFEVNSTDYTYSITLEPLIDLRTIDYCSVIQKGTECVENLS